MLKIKILEFQEVNRAGFEPATHSLEGCCSIQLSYQSPFYFAIAKLMIIS